MDRYADIELTQVQATSQAQGADPTFLEPSLGGGTVPSFQSAPGGGLGFADPTLGPAGASEALAAGQNGVIILNGDGTGPIFLGAPGADAPAETAAAPAAQPAPVAEPAAQAGEGAAIAALPGPSIGGPAAVPSSPAAIGGPGGLPTGPASIGAPGGVPAGPSAIGVPGGVSAGPAAISAPGAVPSGPAAPAAPGSLAGPGLPGDAGSAVEALPSDVAPSLPGIAAPGTDVAALPGGGLAPSLPGAPEGVATAVPLPDAAATGAALPSADASGGDVAAALPTDANAPAGAVATGDVAAAGLPTDAEVATGPGGSPVIEGAPVAEGPPPAPPVSDVVQIGGDDATGVLGMVDSLWMTLVQSYGPAGPFYVIAGFGLLLALIAVPILLKKNRDPLDRFNFREERIDGELTQLRDDLDDGKLKGLSDYLEPEGEDLNSTRTMLRAAGY